MNLLRYSLAVMLISLVGCRTPERAARSPEGVIIAGVKIYGPHKYWTEDKIIALKAAVAGLNNAYPIMRIKFIDADTAEVATGIVRDPLNGVGRDYRFLFKEGKWVTDRSPSLPWVS